MPPNRDFKLGEFQASIDAMGKSLEHILEWQKEFRAEQEDSRRRLYERLDSYEKSNREDFDAIRDTLTAMERANVTSTDMISRLGDATESHGDAIVDLERRVSEIELHNKVRAAKEATSRRWLRWILGFMGVTEGAHISGLGQKLLKMIGDSFGAKHP